MADATKAANHIDFTSIPYDGPALQQGRDILGETRKAVEEKKTSAQHGWYFSGQLEHRVIVEKDPGAYMEKMAVNPMYKTTSTSYGAPSHLAKETFAPGAPKEYMAQRHANGMDGRFTVSILPHRVSRVRASLSRICWANSLPPRPYPNDVTEIPRRTTSLRRA